MRNEPGEARERATQPDKDFGGARQKDAPESLLPSVRLYADVLVTDGNYIIEVDLPGVPLGDVHLSMSSDALVLEGIKTERLTGRGRPSCERAERQFGSFHRVFELPGPADLSRTRAELEKGVLTVLVPRIQNRRGERRPVPITYKVDP